MLKTDIDSDLKAAMLSGDKRLVAVLRSLKSAILYKEVEASKRDEGLSDEEVLAVLKKEKKSRLDSSAMYHEANEVGRAEEEDYQISVIDKYLPESLSEEDTRALVEGAVSSLGIEQPEMKHMGQIIGEVKKKESSVDGALVSKIVKELM